MNTDNPIMIEFRILYRKGPGDTYEVIQRRVPVEADTWHLPTEFFEMALTDIAPTNNGFYLVQDLGTHETREYRVATVPVISEM